tara:strand:- start:51 stop:335 length:285 start_codon:yes stop_codon:yes gene_type:complete
VEKQKNKMANSNLQSVIDHSLVKTFTPIAVAALVGSVGFLFTMLLDLENKALKNEQAIIHSQQESNDLWDDIEKLEGDVTNIRIFVGNGFNKNH